MINMDLTFDVDDFGFGKGFDARAVKLIGATAVGIIKERTQNKKLDPDGKRFIAYSSSYRKFREKNGRNGDPVDLTFTGQMVGSTKILSRKTTRKVFEAKSKNKRQAKLRRSKAKQQCHCILSGNREQT